MPPNTWKKFELDVARLFGTEREKRTTENWGKKEVDAKTEYFAIQCKYNKTVRFAEKDLEKAEKLYPKKIAVCVYKSKGKEKKYIILQLQDFLNLIDPLLKAERIMDSPPIREE